MTAETAKAEREKSMKDLAELEARVDANFKNDWNKSAELRKEFGGNYDAYVAYMKAAITGRAKIYGGQQGKH